MSYLGRNVSLPNHLSAWTMLTQRLHHSAERNRALVLAALEINSIDCSPSPTAPSSSLRFTSPHKPTSTSHLLPPPSYLTLVNVTLHSIFKAQRAHSEKTRTATTPHTALPSSRFTLFHPLLPPHTRQHDCHQDHLVRPSFLPLILFIPCAYWLTQSSLTAPRTSRTSSRAPAPALPLPLPLAKSPSR
jgi:hypothetical protein